MGIKSKFWNNIIISVLPVVYLLIFLPQLSNKIAPNNHNLLITLTTVENWMEEGAVEHNFNLVHSWGNEGDLNIHYYKRVVNEAGRNYFVSYPPFATILVYPFLQLFPKEYLPIGFKLFGMLVHLLTYLALLILFKGKRPFQRVFGASIFLFFPASIVLSGMYYPEQLVLLLLICFAIVLQRRTNLVLIGFLAFLLVYTDWLGILAIASVFLMKILKKGNAPLVPIIAGSLLALLLLVFQYSLIDGWDGLMQGLKIRYLERSGIFPKVYSDQGVNLISSESIHFVKNHLLHSSIISLIIIILLKPKFKNLEVLFWVVSVPIILHLFLLFNANILHYQNLSKVGLLLSVIAANVSREGKVKWLLAPVIILYADLACLSYWEDYPVNSKIYEEAEFIKKEADPSKVIVVEQEGFSENLVILSYLTKRNLVWSNSDERTRQILSEAKQREYILFDLKGKKATSKVFLNQ